MSHSTHFLPSLRLCLLQRCPTPAALCLSTEVYTTLLAYTWSFLVLCSKLTFLCFFYFLLILCFKVPLFAPSASRQLFQTSENQRVTLFIVIVTIFRVFFFLHINKVFVFVVPVLFSCSSRFPDPKMGATTLFFPKARNGKFPSTPYIRDALSFPSPLLIY